MQIILKEDIIGLGYKNDIVDVKSGYGRNYLIPQGKAVIASPSAKKILAENLKQQAHKLAAILEAAKKEAEALNGVTVTIASKVSATGVLYGSVNAAQVAAEDAAKTAYDLGLRKVKAYVKGPGAGRESAIRTIHGAGIEVTEIVDVTPMPHNGCRPKGRRKV